jgi:hypothetical protein
VQKNGAIEGADSHKTKKSAAIAKKVEESRREEDKEGMLTLVEAILKKRRMLRRALTFLVATCTGGQVVVGDSWFRHPHVGYHTAVGGQHNEHYLARFTTCDQ